MGYVLCVLHGEFHINHLCLGALDNLTQKKKRKNVVIDRHLMNIVKCYLNVFCEVFTVYVVWKYGSLLSPDYNLLNHFDEVKIRFTPLINFRKVFCKGINGKSNAVSMDSIMMFHFLSD